MNQCQCISQHCVALSHLSGMVCYMCIWSNVLLLVLPLSKSVGRIIKIRLPRTIAGCFNLCILFPNSPHLLEIMYYLVITAAVSNPHLSYTIIRNMPIHDCFTIYVEITRKGMRVTYRAVWPHATAGFGAVSQRHEPGAEGQFTLEGCDSVAHNYQVLCCCWDCLVCRNCWCRLIQNSCICRKKYRVEFLRTSVLSAQLPVITLEAEQAHSETRWGPKHMICLKAVTQNFLEVNKSLLRHPDSFRSALCKGFKKY